MAWRHAAWLSGLTALVAALAVSLLAVTADPAAARGEGEIVTRKERVVQFGDINLRRTPTLRRAIRAFGRPTSRRKLWTGEGCRVRWRRARVEAVFMFLGGLPPGHTACQPRYGLLDHAVASSDAWWTDEGLYVGDLRAAVLDLYPFAEYHRGAWWLEQIYLPYGDGGYVPSLAAIMEDGIVDGLYTYVGAAGD